MCVCRERERERERKHCRTFIPALHWECTEGSLLSELSLSNEEEGRKEDPHMGRSVARDSPPTRSHKVSRKDRNNVETGKKKKKKYCTVTGFPGVCGSMHL